jgi:diguanylate cyclase (GGDEF)-like protein
MLAGALVIVGGWALDVAALRSVLPGLATMKVNTALGISLLGAALCLAQRGIAAARLSRAAAAAAAAIGLVTLLEYGLDWDAGIDQWLLGDRETAAKVFPGRPSHATAFELVALGIGMLCIGSRSWRHAKTGTAVIALLVSWIAVNGHLFNAQALYGIFPYSSMAVHTAAICVLLSLGLLATEPLCLLCRTVLAKDLGGVVSRWLLPFAVLAPPVLGWLFSHGSGLGIYRNEFGWTLYSVSTTVGSVGLILLLAHRIAVLDAERTTATELSRRDPLTGLWNRRAFDSRFLEDFSLAKRHSRPLSLLVLDVDNFKAYNDAFGHPAGDELLQSVARLISGHMRDTDLVARIGGEEFAVVLPETDLAGALVLAERVREEVERLSHFRRPVTVSIGVATLDRGTKDGATLLKRADIALYRAKQEGRNRVCCESMHDAEPADDIPA